MYSHEVNIYHCQKCGKVTNRECTDPGPDCCGATMSLAVAHIKFDSSTRETCTTEEVIERSHFDVTSTPRT